MARRGGARAQFSFTGNTGAYRALTPQFRAFMSLDLRGHFFAKALHGYDASDAEFHAFPSDDARARWIASCETTADRERMLAIDPRHPPLEGRYACGEPRAESPVFKHTRSRHLDGLKVYEPDSPQEIPLCACIPPLTVKAWAYWASKLGIGSFRPFRVLGFPRKNWEEGDLVSAADMNKLEELVQSYKRYALIGPFGAALSVILWLIGNFVL